MTDHLDPAALEQLLARHRPFVAHVIQDLARKHHLSGDEIDELARRVERALERNDYELLRIFDERSSWDTYLTTVVSRLFLAYQSERWGHWRPTPRATKMGPTAVLLEELISRDRLSLTEAIHFMRTTHRVDVPRPKLEELAHDLDLLTGANDRSTMCSAVRCRLAPAATSSRWRCAMPWHYYPRMTS